MRDPHHLEPGGATLVAADKHATILSVVLASKEERIHDLVPVVEKANGTDGFAVNITGINTRRARLHQGLRR